MTKIPKKNKITGYKVFNPDWICKGFQYEVGKTYHHEGSMELCGSGFHFCEKLVDCFNYYSFNPKNKVAEIVATDEVIKGDDKSVTNNIEIVRELSWNDVLNLVNTGKGNTGFCNSGDCNSGDYNSGNRNSATGTQATGTQATTTQATTTQATTTQATTTQATGTQATGTVECSMPATTQMVCLILNHLRFQCSTNKQK